MFRLDVSTLSETEVNEKLTRLKKRLNLTPLYLFRNWLTLFVVFSLVTYLFFRSHSLSADPNALVVVLATSFVVSFVIAAIISSIIDDYKCKFANLLIDRHNQILQDKEDSALWLKRLPHIHLL